MQQLSMTDAFMLAAETDKQKLQMASVSVLAPPTRGRPRLTTERLRRLVAERLHTAPVLRRRLITVPLGLHHPYWFDAGTLDLDYHVRGHQLQQPGDERMLAEAVGEIVSDPLDHTRPLWQLHLIEGLADKRSALVFKLHHATVDGISGLELHSVVFDPTPTPRKVAAPEPAQPSQPPSGKDLLVRGIASLPSQLLRSLSSIALSLPYLDQLMPFRVTPGVPTVASTARRVSAALQSRCEHVVLEGQGLHVPKTVFDVPVTGQRRWAFTRLALADAKRIKHHLGVTLNDVIVAVVAGALRSWLHTTEDLPSAPLVAVVPISVRSDDTDKGGNEVQVMFIPLPTDEADPQQRLSRTSAALRSAKERHRAVPAAAMRAADALLMPALFIRASRAAMLLTGLRGETANVIVSNVPGPATPVYVYGTEVEALYPVGGVVGGFGLSTIVFSYRDALEFGFVVDHGCPVDPWGLAEACQREQRELLALVPPGEPT